MAKILVATEKPFAAVAVKGIREVVEGAGMELALLEKYTEKAQLLDAVKDADAVIIRSDKVDAEVLDAAKNLKIVVRAGAGYDNVDLDAATAHKVCVMNTPGQNSNAVAELVFGMLVYGVRNFYNGTSGTELKGKKLGILAYGNVGRNVARIAKGFGMEVYAYDAFCPASVIEADGVKAVASTADLFKACQIVSLHIPATAETKGSINFELMNSKAMFHLRKQRVCGADGSAFPPAPVLEKHPGLKHPAYLVALVEVGPKAVAFGDPIDAGVRKLGTREEDPALVGRRHCQRPRPAFRPIEQIGGGAVCGDAAISSA